MSHLQGRISDVSLHLQSLTAPDIFPKVKEAVEKKDRNLLVEACRIAKIPEIYIATVVSILQSVSPQQKWPEFY